MGMGNIEIFVYDYCEAIARISQLSRLLFPHYFLLKSDYKHIELFLNVFKNAKNCYGKKQLSRYWTIIIAPYNYCKQ